MTVYARGYRRYDGLFAARGPRWLPILREGFRQQTRGWAFVGLSLVVLFIVVLMGFFLYFQAGFLGDVFRGGRGHRPAMPLVEGLTPRFFLEAALVRFHDWSSLFVMLLTLFVGSGLVADDVKARALPLYLVRPITPWDYYLGKLLIPVCVLGLVLLAPGLFLVLLASLLRPSEEMLPFLAGQADLVGSLLLHFVAVSLAYSSLVLLFSSWTSRRITAVILGAVAFLGGEVLRGSLWRVKGGVADLLRAASLGADARAVLFGAMGREIPGEQYEPPFPSTAAAVLVLCAVVVLGALVVLRRARSVEVVA